MPARFITFEGGEGAGKSTQLRLLHASLTAAGIRAIATREPGGAPEAEFLRTLLLGGEHDFAPQTETLLHFAARAEHLARTIRPALQSGTWVLCDRFFDSTEAYQGFGQGAGREVIATLKTLIDPHPDLTLILDVSEETAAMRQAAGGRRTVMTGSAPASTPAWPRAFAPSPPKTPAGACWSTPTGRRKPPPPPSCAWSGSGFRDSAAAPRKQAADRP
jgi:dTMP kinase